MQENPGEARREGLGGDAARPGKAGERRLRRALVHPVEGRALPEERREVVRVGAETKVLEVDDGDAVARGEQVVAVKVAMTQGARMPEDLGDERVGPRVVRAPLGRRQRAREEQVEDGFAREVELAPKERGVERGIEPGIGKARDRRRGLRGAAEPERPVGGRRRETRREVVFAEVLDDVPAVSVVGDQDGNADDRRQRGSGGEPAAARIRFFVGVDDADRRAIAREVQPKIAAPPDVPGQSLDGERRDARPTRELFEAGGVGREQAKT